jgi:hypothetical protein
MSHGREQHDPFFWDKGPPPYLNGHPQNGFVPPYMRDRTPNQPPPPGQPIHPRNQGPLNRHAYARHSMPPEPHKQMSVLLKVPSNE